MKISSLIAACAVALLPSGPAHAEQSELRVAEQFGVAYLPFVVMQKQRLIEKHAAKNGLPSVKVSWLKLGGGSSMNDALISGNLDFASSGIPAFLILWSKTKGSANVRVAAGLNNIPVFLNTVNPKVKSIRDFTEADKIALPAVKVSLQAIVLQMAAAKEWGPDKYAQLDRFTVSMRHPDAMIAMLSGKNEVTAHFTSPPYMFQELERPGVRLLLNSADLLGPHNFNVIYTSDRFRKENPRLYRSYMEALDEAMEIIKRDKPAAAKLYLEASGGKPEQLKELEAIVTDPTVDFTTVPNGLMKFADFMHAAGTLGHKPASWQELCFPEAAAKTGS